MSETAAATAPGSTWFGQPKGLTILFLTQMWEQFSYYGMRALLVYYMTRELLLGQEKASLIYGAYIGGFLAPLICGTLGELYGWHVGFAAAGVGMLAGLVIYLLGGAYLPDQESQHDAATTGSTQAPQSNFSTFVLLLGVGVAVTVFRSAYEQIGNTVAIWSDIGVTRQVGSLLVPVTWFQSLNPLLVFLMTPTLLAYWRRRADQGLEPPATRRMALGALIVALSYVLLAGVAAEAGPGRASGLWLVLYFGIFTLGELHILPTGLGLFARLAPPRFAATTVAAWFLAIFTGSLAAGAVGTLWSSMSHAAFFALLAALATVAALLLVALDHVTSP